MRHVSFAVLVVLLVAGCGSTGATRPASIARPDIRTEPVGNVFFGSSSSAPVTLEVTIRNNATTAITARHIDISAPGMQTYTIRPVRRIVREVIAPGDTRTITLFSTAHTSVRDPIEPLTLRTNISFEAEGTQWHEIVQH